MLRKTMNIIDNLEAIEESLPAESSHDFSLIQNDENPNEWENVLKMKQRAFDMSSKIFAENDEIILKVWTQWDDEKSYFRTHKDNKIHRIFGNKNTHFLNTIVTKHEDVTKYKDNYQYVNINSFYKIRYGAGNIERLINSIIVRNLPLHWSKSRPLPFGELILYNPQNETYVQLYDFQYIRIQFEDEKLKEDFKAYFKLEQIESWE